MEENKKVLYLMQNVCDKLDALVDNINTIKADQLDSEIFGEFIELQKQILMKQHKLNINQTSASLSLMEIKKSTKSIGNEPNVINQKKEYFLFGKDTPFSSKLLLITIAFIFIASSGFKYIPSYLNENSELKTERDEYKLFYEYVFLNEYNERSKVPANVIEILNKIKKEDTSFIQNLNALNKKYSNQLKKETLLKQLENLDNER